MFSEWRRLRCLARTAQLGVLCLFINVWVVLLCNFCNHTVQERCVKTASGIISEGVDLVLITHKNPNLYEITGILCQYVGFHGSTTPENAGFTNFIPPTISRQSSVKQLFLQCMLISNLLFTTV